MSQNMRGDFEIIDILPLDCFEPVLPIWLQTSIVPFYHYGTDSRIVAYRSIPHIVPQAPKLRLGIRRVILISYDVAGLGTCFAS